MQISTRSLAPVFAFATILAVPNVGKASDLREPLEGLYKRWRTAILKKDATEWFKVTSNYSKRIIRNTIVSQKRKFPDALFDAPVRPPSIDGLKFLGAQAVGRTAQAVYYGKVSFSLAEESSDLPPNLLVLRFIKDGAEWKFDTTRMVALASVPEIRKDIEKGDYSFLEDEAFSPPGTVAPLPRECPRPERIAHLQVVSVGYETAITINGQSRHMIADTASSELIIGGLRAGLNQLQIRTRPAMKIAGQEQPPKRFEIRIFTVDDKASQKPVEVFSYKPKEVPSSYQAHVRGLPN